VKKLISLCLSNQRLVLAGVLLFCGLGIYTMTVVPVDAVPDITNTQVMVNTRTGSLSPEQIERQVTYPVELELNGIPGVQEIRSLSKYGLSQVIVIFENSTDIYWARAQVFERLSIVSLPKNVKPELAPITTGLGEVVMYTVQAKPGSELSRLPEISRLIRLRELQERVIRPELRRISGVADVDTNGGFRKEIHINVFPERLEAHGLSLLELKKLVENVGRSAGGGYIQESGNQIIVGVMGDLKSADEVKLFPLKVSFRGKVLNVSDVAEVRIESGLRVGAATSRGEETVLGTVLMQSGANSRLVASQCVDKLNSLSLPDEAEIKIHYTRSFLVDTTIRTVTRSLLEGAALVVLVLIVLVGDLRSSLLVASVIPISLLGAFIGMKITGVSANLMSLGAIDFGLIVDGAVVLVENVVRRAGNPESLAKGRTTFFLDSCLEVIKPILFGVLIIMLVYAPILFLGGVEGKMFRPMAVTVLFALVTSLTLTLVFVPVAASLFLKIEHEHKTPWLFQKLESLYDATLKFIFRRRSLLVVPTAVILVFAIWVLTAKLGSDFIPKLDEGDMVIGLVRGSSQGITESIRQQKLAEERILKFGEVETVFSRMGTPDSATDPMSVNFADTFVILKKDKSQWPVDLGLKRISTKEELFQKIKLDLEKNLPPQDITQTQPIEMRFNEILEGSRADVTLRFFGPDLSELSRLIKESKAALDGMPGLSDAQFDSLTALTKSQVLEIQPRAKQMADYSVNFNDLRDGFSLALAGEEVGVIYDYDRAVPVILHLDESLRESEAEIARLPIDTVQGGVVAIRQVAELKRSERVTTIARSWGQRYSALSLFVKGRDIDSFVQEAQKIVEAKIKLPPDYRVYWGGQFRNMAEAKARFAILIPITLFLMLFLLYRNFGALPEALLVFGFRGFSLTVPAIIGFIALAGVAVLNGVVMLSFIADLRSRGLSSTKAVMTGAKLRLRPVMMTALVAALGFIPMALNTGLGSEVQRPLATVVIGGLISATLLTLVLLPIAYDYFCGDLPTSKKQN
jgi:heavy metal efflux system protein